MIRIRAAACALALLPRPPRRAEDLRDAVDRAARAVEPRVIEWRRDLHEHPELGNREVRTAALVAKRLRKLGLDVRTGVAHTGVVAVLRGAAERPVVALRADMDALPVTEETGLPFASRVRTTYQGREVGVMHACGHDAHTAILLGVAEVLAGVRDRAARHGAVRVPARRGGAAAGRARRREPDARGGRVRRSRRPTPSSGCTSSASRTSARSASCRARRWRAPTA